MAIVCGPPAAGKSSYVRTHALANDLIIDLDTIAASLSGLPEHGWGTEWLRPALIARNQYLNDLTRRTSHHYPMAWLIVGEPEAAKRNWWKEALNADRVIVIETPEAICVARIMQDALRIDKPKACNAVRRWWQNYTRQTGEIIIKDNL